MSQIMEAKVPDIGDYHDVPVIDVCVQAGDRVQVDDPLVTLESDKATMDIPSSVAGIVREVKVSLGDKVSEGSVVVLIEAADPAAVAAVTATPPAASAAPAPQAAAPITGSADLGLQTVLVERYPTLGGVCLNVGCIPSKALLHIAGVMEEAQHMGDCGVRFAAPSIDLDQLRLHKDKVVGTLTGGLAGMAKGRKVEVVQGVGQFVDANHLEVALAGGGSKLIRFQKAIIAAGSQPIALPFMPNDDPRVVDSTGALELRQIPQRIPVAPQLRTNVPHIFAIGDIVGQPMLAHKGVHEAHVAAEAAHGSKRCFDALQIPSVAYTDPEIAWAGKTEEQCRSEGITHGKSVFPWAASGRALANGRAEGFTKLIFDEATHRIIGGSIVGTDAGDLIGEVCLAIEMGCDAADIGHTIHPHPTLGESVGMAAEVYEGVCTDLPAVKKR